MRVGREALPGAAQPEQLVDEGGVGVVMSVAFSPDGKLLISGVSNGNIRLWDVASGTPLYHFLGHGDHVASVAFSPDGKSLASGGDAKIKLWLAKGSRELATLFALGETDWVVATPDGLFDGSPAAWNKLLWRFGNDTFNYVPVEAFFGDFFYPAAVSRSNISFNRSPN